MAQDKPNYIMPENVSRILGRDAQRNNILAGRIVAETVKSTLGPKGMDKMLVDAMGDITVTNDGVTILDEMQIEHPAAKMIVEIAKTQEEIENASQKIINIADDDEIASITQELKEENQKLIQENREIKTKLSVKLSDESELNKNSKSYKDMTLEEFKKRITKEDVIRYIEKLGTKKPEVQEIIYKQAKMTAKKDIPAYIFKEVHKILKK